MSFIYYPNISDNDFYKNIVNKKEFYINRIPENRPSEEEYCNKKNKEFELLPQQAFLKNYVSEDTHYLNIGIIHGTGVGKTNSAIAIAENLQPMIEKYNSKIYILTPGQDSKNNFIFKGILGDLTKEKYITNEEREEIKLLEKVNTQNSKEEIKKINRRVTQRYKKKGHYRVTGYEKFANRVIGRKEIDKKTGSYKKNEDGELIREIKGIKIDNVDNCVLIVDEAHNILNNNDFRKAIYDIMKRSVNTRLVLLTATPMFHEPTQIISFLELIRLPIHQENIKVNEIFKTYDDINKEYELQKDGLEKIKKLSKGYISYLRGIDPTTFPNRIEVGDFSKPSDVPKKEYIKYTPLVRCEMSKLQYKTYLNEYTGKNPKPIIYLSNMVLPNPENEKLGLFKNEDIENIYSDSNNLKKLKNKYDINVSYFNENILISGNILKKENLKNYSPKYVKVLENMELTVNKKCGKIFIYIEDIRGVGLIMFSQILKENGYLQYLSERQTFNDNNLDVETGLTLKKHRASPKVKTEFKPSKFIIISGSEDSKVRQKLIDEFNSPENAIGSKIKILLGSKVTRESIDLKAVKQIHIINAQWNFSTIEQIIGRGIRHCSHNGLTGEQRDVYVFKYVSCAPGKKYKESAEEKIYREIEKAHVTVKKIERALKESAIDCVLNKRGNVFPEEIKDSKNCSDEKNNKLCDRKCDYMECDYNCDYELPKDKDNNYVVLKLKDLNKDTYTINFANYEIDKIINIIKKIFSESHVETLKTIKEYIYENYSNNYFEDEYIFVALNKMIDEKIILNDKYKIEGYLIYRGEYYIFQPKNKSEDISISERSLPIYQKDIKNKKIDKYINISVKNITKENEDKIDKDLIKNTMSFLSKNDDQDKIAQYLSRLKIREQEIILKELIINNINNKLSGNYLKIKKCYEQLLLYGNNLLQLSTTDSNLKTGTQIIGYIFKDKVIVYHKNKWSNGKKYINEKIKSNFNKKPSNNEENNVIIGFIDQNKDKMVFKLRPKISNTEDKRKIEKGFVCNQSSDKGKIIDIAKKLNLDTKGKKISVICNEIELKLRKNERINKGNKKWFYDYKDIIKL
jgi:hypothetical protein